MRKVWLNREDFGLFHQDITPYEYEFFRAHSGAFKRMWQEQVRFFINKSYVPAILWSIIVLISGWAIMIPLLSSPISAFCNCCDQGDLNVGTHPGTSSLCEASDSKTTWLHNLLDTGSIWMVTDCDPGRIRKCST